LHRVDNGERRGPTVARHSQKDAARSVRSNDVCLRHETVVDGGNVFHVDGGAVDGLDWQHIEVVDDGQAAVQTDRIFRAGKLRGSRRHDEVLEVQGVGDINRRQPLRVELVEIQVHRDLAVLSTERIGDGGSLNGRKRRPNEVVAKIEDFLLGESRAAQSQL